MLAFRSLDPFRALREPDRRRRDEERLSRSEQRTLSKTQNNHLTGKAPYKFESTSLQPAESRAKLHFASWGLRSPGVRATPSACDWPGAQPSQPPRGAGAGSGGRRQRGLTRRDYDRGVRAGRRRAAVFRRADAYGPLVSNSLFPLKATLFGRPSTDNGRPTYRDGSGNAADRPKSLHIALHGAGTRRPSGEMPPMRP